MQTDAEPAATPQSVERRLGAAAAQIEYMTTEIAKALEQEPGNAADTVWMVRTFAKITAEREATLTAEFAQEQTRLRAALTVALKAMQANIAYATLKDEHALVRGIEAVRDALIAHPSRRMA